jgi:4-diphosphocytidyl-2-C-methyl-D-erythritol kinase
MRVLTVRAPAKVNLLLHVEWPPRPDGYHNVVTIMQAVSLYDELEVRLSPRAGIAFACDDPSLPRGRDNLAVRAAQSLLGHMDMRSRGVELRLTKRIPVAAGLGGGSADAAAALVALRSLLAPELPDGMLESLAADTGSDAPFFIRGGTQVGIGRGELLSPVEPSPCDGLALVIVKPEGGCSTAEVYSRYDRSRQGARILASPAGALALLAKGSFVPALSNDLEPIAEALNPAITLALDALRDEGLAAQVSGSGSACFGIARDRVHAERVAAKLGDRFPFVAACLAQPEGCEVVRKDG